jgi:molybdopterin synthase catalytic subunit
MVKRVKVVFHAEFRRAAGVTQTELDILEPTTVRDLLTIVVERVPELQAMVSRAIEQGDLGSDVLVSIDGQLATLDTLVQPGDELRLLPPISGGQNPQQR